MSRHSAGPAQEPGGRPTENIPPRRRLNFVFVLVVVLLYIGDFLAGEWLFFYELPANINPVSFLFWFASWGLTYLAFRRSKTFGWVLLGLTLFFTVLTILGVILIAFLEAPGA